MSFTVVLASQNKLSGTNGDAVYNINWSFLPDCDHKVSFSFTSKSLGLTNPQTINQVYLLTCPDLGSRQVYIAGRTTSTQSSNEIGIIRPYGLAVDATTYYGLTSTVGDNPAIILRGRPSNNQFGVQIYAIDKSAIFVPAADYVLILHFEKIEKVEY